MQGDHGWRGALSGVDQQQRDAVSYDPMFQRAGCLVQQSRSVHKPYYSIGVSCCQTCNGKVPQHTISHAGLVGGGR